MKRVIVMASLVLCFAACSPTDKPSSSVATTDVDYASMDAAYLNPEARTKLEVSAANGNGAAAFRLYVYYESYEINPNRGEYWFRKSAELGNQTAIENLNKQKFPESEYLDPAFLSKLEAVAANGNSDAAFRLCLYYAACEANSAKEDYWLRKSASLGNQDAIFNVNPPKLLTPYHLDPESRDKLEEAAAKGSGDAALRLNQYYEISQDNLITGEYWLRKSAALGNQTAIYNLNFLEKLKEANRKLPKEIENTTLPQNGTTTDPFAPSQSP
jgi:TPR repeat protein